MLNTTYLRNGGFQKNKPCLVAQLILILVMVGCVNTPNASQIIKNEVPSESTPHENQTSEAAKSNTKKNAEPPREARLMHEPRDDFKAS